MSKRKNSERLIECWAKDFCDLSGVAAHSNNRKTDRFVWSEFWHLAFASILFPLLVKARLAELGCLEIKEIDKEHLKFIERIEKFKNEFEKGNGVLSFDLIDFLKNWLLNHILKVDMKYVPFLKSKGLK